MCSTIRDQQTPGNMEKILLGTFAGISVVGVAYVVSALRKLLARLDAPGTLAFYRLALALLLSALLTHVVDIVSIVVPQDTDFLCDFHGAVYMYLLLWFYCMSMFLAMESFLCLLAALSSLNKQNMYALRRWKRYCIFSLTAIHAQYLYTAVYIGFGRSSIGCFLKGSDGPNSGLSQSSLWKFHWFPVVTLCICALSVVAMYLFLTCRMKGQIKMRIKVISRMALLPLLAYISWTLMFLRRHDVQAIKRIPLFVLRALIALKGFYMSLFLYLMNDKIRDSVNTSFRRCFQCSELRGNRDEDHLELDNFRESSGPDYVQLSSGGSNSNRPIFTEFEPTAYMDESEVRGVL